MTFSILGEAFDISINLLKLIGHKNFHMLAHVFTLYLPLISYLYSRTKSQVTDDFGESLANSSTRKCIALYTIFGGNLTPLRLALRLSSPCGKACIIHVSSQRRRGGTNVGSRSIVSSGCLRLSPPSHSTIVHPFPPNRAPAEKGEPAPARPNTPK